jgi:hypothetical protein
VGTPAAVAPASATAQPARPRVRQPAHDYAYVRRDVQRILILTVAVLIAIVVISFFLP